MGVQVRGYGNEHINICQYNERRKIEDDHKWERQAGANKVSSSVILGYQLTKKYHRGYQGVSPISTFNNGLRLRL